MSSSIRFAEPRQVDRPEDCFFYHRIDIPGAGVVGEQWDLRDCIDNYLGGIDFRGKRVLDVGAASGYLTFAMEQRGAEVVSFDMADGAQWNLVPRIELQPRLTQMYRECQTTHRQLQNAYWYTHRRMGSKARVYYGDLYDLPTELGPFDLAVFGMIVSHLRDPFQALYSVSRLVTGSVVIANRMVPADGGLLVRLKRLLGRTNNAPIAHFMPGLANDHHMAWWLFTPACLEQMLGVLGFGKCRTLESQPISLLDGQVSRQHCLTVVADRIAGQACLPKPNLLPAAA